jgi:hypothetical protein
VSEKSQGEIWQGKKGEFFGENQGKQPPNNPDPAGEECFLGRYGFALRDAVGEGGWIRASGSRRCRSAGGDPARKENDAAGPVKILDRSKPFQVQISS